MGNKSKAPRVLQTFVCRKTKTEKRREFKSGGAFGSGPECLVPNVPMRKKKGEPK